MNNINFVLLDILKRDFRSKLECIRQVPFSFFKFDMVSGKYTRPRIGNMF